MLIGIDGNEANVTEKVGSSIYTLELLKYFQKKADKDTRFVVFLKNNPLSDLPKTTPYFSYFIIPAPKFWLQIFLPFVLNFIKRVDVFFSPAHYSPFYVQCPIVVTIHDTAYHYYPSEFLKKDLYKLNNWTKSAVERACHIIAVSKNTETDCKKIYNVPDNKISVVYNGFRPFLQTEDNNQLPNPVVKPFLLYVGTLQPRKNISRLIEAFNLIQDKIPQYKLVITGKKGWMYEEVFEKVKELQLENNVIFTGFVKDTELVSLYKSASVFILPSLYEGFGYPVLEAMAFGCPVILSNNSSLPEVGGNAVTYFNPHDPNDIAKKILTLLENATIRNENIKKGREQVKKFTWEKCGRLTLEILKKCTKI